MVRIRPIAAGLMLVAAAALAYLLAATPAGPRTLRRFDPDRMADVELRMWQAYYSIERVRLFALLVTMLHEQNHYSWVTAMREGFYLARAAATFGDARSNYADTRADILRDLSRRAHLTFWLNPESRYNWNYDDSVVYAYEPHCDEVFEVRNTRQLFHAVDRITRGDLPHPPVRI